MEPMTVESLAAKRPSLWKRFSRNRKAVIGLILLAIISLSAIFAPWVATHNPTQQDLRSRLQPPSAEHWLGTDNFGRDIYSRIVYGARISLRVGLISVTIALCLGGTMGLTAGFFGGRIDSVLMRIVDVLLALPAILLALAVVATLGPGLNNVMIAVGIAYTPNFARVTRAAVLQVRELDFVAAAQALGASHARTMVRHILPNSQTIHLTQMR